MKPKVLILSFVLLIALPFTSFAAQQVLTRVDTPITSGVAASGKSIFFGDAIGNFFAVDIQTGGQRWSCNYSDTAITGIPAVHGDNVVFAYVTGEIICLKISDGSLVWKYSPVLSESVNEDLNDGVAIGGGKVYAAFTTGELKAIDLKSGNVSWSYKAEQGLRSAPAYHDGLVLLGEYNGLFSIINAKNGKRLNGGGAGGAINTPAVHNGNVYYTAWDGSVHAVKIKDVIPLWDAEVGEPISTAPVVGEGLVVVETASGKIFALEEKSGAILWKFDSQGGEDGTRPAISGGRVLTGTGDGRILVLNASNGKLQREYTNANELNSSEGNALYFINNNHDLCRME